MPTTLSPVDVCNSALSRCGAQSIQSLTDLTNTSAIACNVQFQLAYLEVSRASRWNCITNTAVLTEVTQTLLPGSIPAPAAAAWTPLTSYLPLVYLSYGGGIYQTQYAYTSTNNFYNDLTTGALVQADYDSFNAATFGFNNGSQYPSGWGHQYALPSDFQLLVVLNDNNCWNGAGQGSQYEIMGQNIFTNDSPAVIKYVTNVIDTTRFDSLFLGALVSLLASKIVTILRLDSGNMAETFLGEYNRLLSQARTKDAGEQMARRFNPIFSSRFVQSRYWNVNG